MGRVNTEIINKEKVASIWNKLDFTAQLDQNSLKVIQVQWIDGDCDIFARDHLIH